MWYTPYEKLVRLSREKFEEAQEFLAWNSKNPVAEGKGTEKESALLLSLAACVQ
jgi:hypothetical protein